MPKRTLAVYTATGCSACEYGILDVHYQVSSLTPWAEVVFWPHLLGGDWNDLETVDRIDVCIFAGALATLADREAAARLREKSDIMIACGACAAFGGLPGLNNLRPKPTNEPSEAQSSEGPPPLPATTPLVSGLQGVGDIDYVIPGCPPPQNLLWAAIQAVLCGGEPPARISFSASRLPEPIASAIAAGVLPNKGSVFGGEKGVCASCSRRKEEKKFSAVYRPHELDPDSGRCLLEQGLICQGIATREGCGGACTAVGAGCRGCFGKAENVFDAGAKMVSAISSTFDTTDPRIVKSLAEKFVDPAGTFYRYTLAEQCVLMSAGTKE